MARLCPIKRIDKQYYVEFGECDREKCEWWSTFFKECSVTALGFIGFELMKLRKQEKGDGINVNKE